MKQIIKQCAVILLFIFCFFHSFSQSLEQTIDGYSVDGLEYQSQTEIFKLLGDFPDAEEAYRKSIHYKKQSRVFGTLAIVGFSTTMILAVRPPDRQGDSPNFGHVGLVLFGAVLSSVCGGLYYKTISASSRKKKKVVDLYNNSIIGYKDKSQSNSIKIEVNSNGVGLRYAF